MKFELRNITIHAVIYNDIENGVFTISSLEKGAPIISASTIEEAKVKFESALKLSAAVENLLYFKGATKSTSATAKNRRIFLDGIKGIGNIKYHDFVPC